MTRDRARPLLAVTMGDPVGIGPEVIAKAATVSDVRAELDLVVFGDIGVLERVRRDVGIAVDFVPVETASDARECGSAIPVVDVSRIVADGGFHGWGLPSIDTDRAQVRYIESAYDAVMREHADALVTAPISKSALERAGVPWPGHTEMLADLSKTDRPVMMLAGPSLRVVPLTTHIPLSEVPQRITHALLVDTLRVVHHAFASLVGLEKPRIAVAGLNPHAGEGGMLGTTERDVIAPAVHAARAEGIDVRGPFAADSLFHRAATGEFDVVVGMYHDQALIPLKLLDFDRAVNVTLGLPIIRTSVDHGTAYDIAGRGVASARSMMEALRTAARMVRMRKSRANG